MDDFYLHRKVESLENTVTSLRHQLADTIRISQGRNEKLIKVCSGLLSSALIYIPKTMLNFSLIH